jgi:hypothetical protein
MRKKSVLLFKYFFGVIASAASFITIANGQNVSSPYSILGIGDIDTRDYGRYFASGSASLARRDLYSYNFSNPASLTALPFKTMHFDISMRGRSSRFTSPDVDTATFPSNDFIVKRITMAFKVSQKTGIAFGLRPHSSVNYRYLDNETILDGNTSYLKYVDGHGGINQFYFSLGQIVHKNISVGTTVSWLFGSLQRETKYASQAIVLNITKQETDFYSGAVFQGGIQYHSNPGRKWKHQSGLAVSVSTGLNGEYTSEYIEQEISINKALETGRAFKLPVTMGIGYSAVKNEKLTLSIEGNFYNWQYQKVNYTNSYTYPSARFSAGMDYSIKRKKSGAGFERGYFAWGINVENSYLRIKGNELWDYSFSLGGGVNAFGNFSFYSGLEFGRRGEKKADQMKENYTQLIIGVTLKDIWIGPKFSRKYD